MTTAITRPRLDATLELIKRHEQIGLKPPTNYEIAIHIGMGQQKNQPIDRCRGLRYRKPEAGSVMIQALEALGIIHVQRIGRNRREIQLLKTVEI